MLKTLIPWSVLLLAPPLAAQTPEIGVRTYDTVDKKKIRGEILGIEGDRVRMKIHFAQGTMTRRYPLADFTPQSIYRIRLAVAPKDDPDVHLELAQYAMDTHQVVAARASLTTARKIAGDDSLGAEVATALAAAPAKELTREFREQLEKGDTRSAERSLRTLRVKHNDLVTADQLAGLESELEHTRAERQAEVVEKKAAVAEQRVVREREKKLSPLTKRLEAARAARQKGLESSKHFARADAQFKTAVRHSDYVLKRVDRLEKSSGNDPIMVREIELMRDQASDLKVDCLLSSASLHITRGRFTAAMGNVNGVLAIDSGNQRAMAMRGRIEVAANDRGGWGW